MESLFDVGSPNACLGHQVIPAVEAQVFATEDCKEGIPSFVARRKALSSGR